MSDHREVNPAGPALRISPAGCGSAAVVVVSAGDAGGGGHDQPGGGLGGREVQGPTTNVAVAGLTYLPPNCVGVSRAPRMARRRPSALVENLSSSV